MAKKNEINDEIETISDEESSASSSEFTNNISEVDDLKQQLEQQKTEVLRYMADAENARKRAQQEIINNRKFSTEKLLKELLPIADSLEKGIENANNDIETKGLQLIQQLLIDVLKKEGVTIEHPENQEFDPNFHEAIGTEINADAKPNTIFKVLQTGYKLNGRSLRNALVIVNKK